jgi:hypothetical protein
MVRIRKKKKYYPHCFCQYGYVNAKKEDKECQHDATNGKTLVRRQGNSQSHGPSHIDFAKMATAVPVPSPIVPMKPHKQMMKQNCSFINN